MVFYHPILYGFNPLMKDFKWYEFFIAALLIYLFAAQIYAIWPFTIDDMYIPLRYAKNWAAGNGLLWNAHEPPVEGYSNFIFVVLGALSLKLQLNPVIILKAAGVLGLFVTSVFVYLIGRFWFDRREALLSCILLLLYKGQIIWTASGLETTVFQSFMCASVYFVLRGMGYQLFALERSNPNSGFLFLAGLTISLAGLTRPETPVFMLLFLFLMYWDRPQSGFKAYRQGVALLVLAIWIVFLPYFIWRWHYFGYLFPNPVYCKGISTKSFFDLDASYLKLIWPFVILAIPACIKSEDKRHYFLWLPSLTYLVLLLYSETLVAFDNRLFLMPFALLLPLSLRGLSIIILHYFHQRDQIFTLVLNSCVLFLALIFVPKMSLGEYRYFTENPQLGDALRFQVIDWLRDNSNSQDRVVLGDSGMIPYYTDLNFIDSYCLNNEIMAHYPADKKYELFCHQIIEEQPKTIILTSLIDKGSIVYAPSDGCLKKLLEKQNNYKLIKKWSTNNSKATYQYELFTQF